MYRRYEALKDIMHEVKEELVVVNIGSPCKELYEIKNRKENFYMLGSMGLATSIGLGIALSQKNKKIVVIEGDGAILMNLGSLVTIANNNPSNLCIIIIDNGANGSTGFQKTFTNDEYGKTSLKEIAKAAGIENVKEIDGRAGQIRGKIKNTLTKNHLSLLVIKTDIGEPDTKLLPLQPKEIKKRFMKAVLA